MSIRILERRTTAGTNATFVDHQRQPCAPGSPFARRVRRFWVFVNARGEPLSRWGFAYLLKQHAATAAAQAYHGLDKKLPSLLA